MSKCQNVTIVGVKVWLSYSKAYGTTCRRQKANEWTKSVSAVHDGALKMPKCPKKFLKSQNLQKKSMAFVVVALSPLRPPQTNWPKTSHSRGPGGTKIGPRWQCRGQSFSDVRVQVRGLLWSPSPKISDFENPSDSRTQRVCLFTHLYCKVNISQKNSEISIISFLKSYYSLYKPRAHISTIV
jgi:hypothetical protein